MGYRRELVVFGYIHEIELILEKNIIIPIDVKHICLLFYNVSLKLFKYTIQKRTLYNDQTNINMVFGKLCILIYQQFLIFKLI